MYIYIYNKHYIYIYTHVLYVIYNARVLRSRRASTLPAASSDSISESSGKTWLTIIYIYIYT